MLGWLVQNAAVAAALAVVVALVCRFGRFRPAVRHALWLIVLIKLVTPPLFAWPWSPADWWSAQTTEVAEFHAAPAKPKAAAPSPAFKPETVAETLSPAVEAATPPPVEAPTVVTIQPPVEPLPEKPGFAEKPAFLPAATPEPAGTDWPALVLTALVGLWGAGSIVMLGLEVKRIVRFQKLLRLAQPGPRRLRRVVQVLARQLRVPPPRALIVPGLRSPMVWVFGRPRLLWPADWPENWEAESHQAVIVHELAHLRRRDHWVRWVELTAGCVWWWHPVFWWARAQLRLFADWACDAWVIWARPESRRAYAEVLIEATRIAVRPRAPVPALGMADARRAFQRRLTMIMSERIPCRAPRWGLAAIALAGLATIPGWSLSQTPEIQREAELRLQLRRLQAELEKTQAELKQTQALAANYRDLKAVEEQRLSKVQDAAKFYQSTLEKERTAAAKAAYTQEVEKAHAEWTKAAQPAGETLALQLKRATQKRPWGPEQATGAPDTPGAGDFDTAWASRTPDEQDEWLQLEYAQSVPAVAILVFETYNPGAVSRITVSGGPNTPSVSWEVKDPTPVGSEKGVSIFAVPSSVPFKVKTVKLEIASRRVQGWNEIDAVGLLDGTGRVHWASSATASSFYGDEEHNRIRGGVGGGPNPTLNEQVVRWPYGRRDPNVTQETEQRIDRLERDMKEMKDILQEMKNMMRTEQKTKEGSRR